jgi:ubiquinone/menaquinone biosynthesis C-methylase UbiE
MQLNFFRRIFGKEALTYPGEYFKSDKKFDRLYAQYIQELSRRHWTPLAIAQQASSFLAGSENVKILDVGSGAGKFCLAGAYYNPSAQYVGIEQRLNLVIQAETVRDRLGLTNVSFVHGNFTSLDFNRYNHFYFYNSFYEHIITDGHIDKAISFSQKTYDEYTAQLFNKLEKMPAGTKLVTYHIMRAEIPSFFKITREEMEGFLKFCVKI